MKNGDPDPPEPLSGAHQAGARVWPRRWRANTAQASLAAVLLVMVGLNHFASASEAATPGAADTLLAGSKLEGVHAN